MEPESPVVDGKVPTVFAHRGASGDAPENTLLAFDIALDQGTTAIESDLRLTMDGRLIFFHDYVVFSKHGIPWPVHLSTYKWISCLYRDLAIDIADVPSVFEHYSQQGILDTITWSLDVPGTRAFKRLVKTCRAFGNESRILACFTTPEPFPIWRKIAPAMTFVWSIRGKHILTLSIAAVLQTCLKYDVGVLNMKVSEATPELIQAAKDAGITVYLWDVHDKARYELALSYQPDAIYSNYPKKALTGKW